MPVHVHVLSANLQCTPAHLHICTSALACTGMHSCTASTGASILLYCATYCTRTMVSSICSCLIFNAPGSRIGLAPRCPSPRFFPCTKELYCFRYQGSFPANSNNRDNDTTSLHSLHSHHSTHSTPQQRYSSSHTQATQITSIIASPHIPSLQQSSLYSACHRDSDCSDNSDDTRH